MQHESIFAPPPRNGQIYWIRLAARQHIAWLRYGPLLALLLLLLEVPDAFGVLYQADAPARVLNQATLLVIALGGWMLLVDLVYRLAERERHMLLNYLIAWGIAIGLALFNRVLGVLLDDWLDPGGRQYAFQSFCALLLSVITAPLALKLLLHEPLIERLALAYKGPSRWPWVERRLRHYLKLHPDALVPTLLLAEGLLIQGWHEEALVLLKHLTVRHPRAWESWAALGAVALENDRWEQAVSSLSSAIRLAPRAAQGPLHFTLGLALLGSDQLENGYHELDRASRWPLPPHLRHYRWFMLMRLGQVWGAPDLMYRATNAVKNTPRDAWAFLEWYESLDRADLPTLGEDLYEAADWTRRLLNIRRVI